MDDSQLLVGERVSPEVGEEQLGGGGSEGIWGRRSVRVLQACR